MTEKEDRDVLAELVLNATAPYKLTNAWLAADLILAAGFRRCEVPDV